MTRPDPRSDEAKAWRHLYGTAAWKRARSAQLYRQPFCEMCRAQGLNTLATIVNHRKPHRGDIDLFLDPKNHESTCKPHHDGAIQSHERTGVERGCNADGFPNDAASHWNTRGAGEISGGLPSSTAMEQSRTKFPEISRVKEDS